MRLTQIVCPKCKTSLSSKAGIEEGTSIACPKCKQQFALRAPPSAEDEEEVVEDFEVVDDDEDEAPRKKPASRQATRNDDDDDERRPEPKKRVAVAENDDRPAKQRKKDDDDDERRPQAKKNKRDDDEDDDRPRSKKKRKQRKDDEELSGYDKLKNNIWVRVSVLGVLLAILGVCSYLLFIKKEKGAEPVAEKPNDDDDLPKPIIKTDPKNNTKQPTELAAETQKFNGAWSATSVTKDGQKYPAQGLRDFRFDISGNVWQSQGNSRNTSRSKIDPAKKPHSEIDLTHSSINATWPGIYRFVDKDTLEVCILPEAGERPKEFASSEGSNHLHIILKRDTASTGPKKVASDERLKGSWSAMSFSISMGEGGDESGDSALAAMLQITKDPSAIGQIRLTVTDDQFTLDGASKSDQYTIDMAKNPMEIDFLHSDGGKTLGICRLRNNNTLEICFSYKGERPTSFTPTSGSNAACFVFRRNQ